MNGLKLLTDASAFLVSRAYSRNVASQLGKTKLYKMLYMASWWARSESSTRLFLGPWYRIDMGPALTPGDWEALTDSLANRFGIEARRVAMWHGYQQVCFSALRNDPPKTLGKRQRSFLERAFNAIINLTAPEAAALTYTTSPMLWLVAEERFKWGEAVQYRPFSLEDAERQRFMQLVDRYRQGEIDIPQIAHEMGPAWSPHQVALYLDTFSAHRSADGLRLDDSDREKILLRIANAVVDRKVIPHPSPEERALASSRLEGEYFAPSSILD
ncbi:MAG TPA: hypothetical protein VJJ70_02175 [Anaerolineales bacterium]|nr:hypothetical protein [Anaerolineales bacterium]